MINNRQDLKEFLKYEKKLYINENLFKFLGQLLAGSYNPKIYRYLIHLRKEEYYYNTKHGIVKKVLYCYHKNRKRKIGLKLGIDIGHNAFDKGLKIMHPFAIIVNGDAKIGKNCCIHGNVCIGNNGIENDSVPILGDNIDIGYGAIVIGKIKVADNIKIGANSLVNKSFENKGIVIAGSPAKEIKK